MPRGTCLVPSVEIKGLLYQLPLIDRQTLLEAAVLVGGVFAFEVFTDATGDLPARDRFSIAGKCNDPVNLILQFPDVSRPRVPLEKIRYLIRPA